MKTIGLIGGMSWESTTSYYQLLNKQVRESLGKLHSAKLCLYSVDFNEIAELQHKGDWQATADILIHAAQSVEAGGADFVLICTNTMHKVADEVAGSISIPILHIADATAQQLLNDGVTRVGLLATKFTMEQDFYKQRLIDNFGIGVLIPEAHERQKIHDIIYQELCHGKINDHSRQVYLEAIENLVINGAQGIILGCTEIGLLIQACNTNVPLYDTTEIHCKAATSTALK